MNNKHQELIIEKVAEFANQHPKGLAETLTFFEKTLQDIIDTVLAEERERWIKAVGEKIDKTTRELMMASFREGVEETTNQFEAAMKAMTSTKIVDKALDKTLPNKV